MIVRGIFYQGGKTIPSKDYHMNPNQFHDMPGCEHLRLSNMAPDDRVPTSPVDRLNTNLQDAGDLNISDEQDDVTSDLFLKYVERKIQTLPPGLKQVAEQALASGDFNRLLELGVINPEELQQFAGPEDMQEEGDFDDGQVPPPDGDEELPPGDTDEGLDDEDGLGPVQTRRQYSGAQYGHNPVRFSRTSERSFDEADTLLPHEAASLGLRLQYDGSGLIRDEQGRIRGRFYTE
jgi:hypothetical protein